MDHDTMFGLGTGELIIVLAIALILIGPDRLPQIATKLGRLTRQVKQAIEDLKGDFDDSEKKK